MPEYRPDESPARIRCLGPGPDLDGAEHYFDSPNRLRVRLCPTCQNEIDAMGVMAEREAVKHLGSLKTGSAPVVGGRVLRKRKRKN